MFKRKKIMKKDYMKPIIVAVKIDDTILAESDVSILSAGDGNDAMSKYKRGRSSFDFDFEEEEEE